MNRMTPVDVALVLVAALAMFAGWHHFWFLTDDAFIAFRYVSNSLQGFGYVWNPPPFLPVEGYTSFLWVALLDLVWRATGIAPPQAANWLSLAFGYATLWLVVRFALRMRLPGNRRALRTLLLGGVLLGTLSNRSFLTWLSSGLETAMFNFFVTAWLYQALAPTGAPPRARIAWLSLATLGCALSRPDGLLFYAATLALIAIDELRRGGSSAQRAHRLLPAVLLLAVPVHLAWRRFEYGQWLPNTYYAKVVSMWPESGALYLFSFVLENGVWVWLLLTLAWALRAPWRVERYGAALLENAAVFIAIATLLAHFAYYTFAVGGDHFEYRVYSHLVPLLFLSAMWLVTRLSTSGAASTALLLIFVVASWPIAWTHHLATRDLTSRDLTYKLVQPIADRFPFPLSPVVARWDAAQAWLIEHLVGMRHQEHKAFYLHQQSFLPSREEGERIGWGSRPVLHMRTVGVAGWVLPHVAIIDYYGLNDRVIARTPPPQQNERLMAHDRQPPPGYAECFRPNVRIEDAHARVIRRPRPLRDAEIRSCETRSWNRVEAAASP